MAPGAKTRLLRVRSALHRELFARSGGRLLARWGGHPVVLLTTAERSGGAPRRTVLVAPLGLDEPVVLAASNGGAARHPGWYRNLVASPEIEVVFGGRRRSMRARTATAEERASLWPRFVAAAPAYARYQ